MSGSVAVGPAQRASPEGAIEAAKAGHRPSSPRHVPAQSVTRVAVAPRGRLTRGLGRVLPVPGGGLAARLQHQLVEDVGDVALDGVRAEIEAAGDQLVAVAGGDVAQHLELARTERRRARRRAVRPRRRCRSPAPGGRAGAGAVAGEQPRPRAQRAIAAPAGAPPSRRRPGAQAVAPSISTPAPGWPSRPARPSSLLTAAAASATRPRPSSDERETQPHLVRLADRR